MVRELEIINQCIIVSGESGAGKVLYGERAGEGLTSVSLSVGRAEQGKILYGERAGDYKPVYHC